MTKWNPHNPDGNPPLTPDQFATFMADVVAANLDDFDNAVKEGVALSHALLVDLGYAEGVLIFNEMEQFINAGDDE